MQNTNSTPYRTIPGVSKPKTSTLPALITVLGLTLASSTQAATITVTSASDEAAPANACSLRGAVMAINGGGDANGCAATGAYGSNDTILFAPTLADSAITFTSQVEIQKNMVIDGALPGENPIVLDGNSATRLFHVNGGTALTLSHLILQHGYATSEKYGEAHGGAVLVDASNHTLTILFSCFERNGAYAGGAIRINDNSSAVIVNNSAFSNNFASYAGAIWAYAITINNSIFDSNIAFTNAGAVLTHNSSLINNSTFNNNLSAYNGGAIAAYYEYNNTILENNTTINNSTFSNNSADQGGSVFADTITTTNSTFDNNSASNQGGAIHAHKLSASYATLVNNTAPDGAAIYIFGTAETGTGIIKNSLIVGDANTNSVQCTVRSYDESFSVISGGGNIEWRNGNNENSCNSTSPVLVPAGMTLEQIVSPTLADNGGPTQTLALPTGSPAIDAGDPAVAGTTDQRGESRPQGNGPDLGAFEAASVPPGPAPYTHADATTRIENGTTLTTINGQLVPYPEHVGKKTAVFVFANIAGTNDWLLLNPVSGWHPWVDCNSTAFPYAMHESMPWVTDIALFYDADLSAFQGWPILFGYGVGDDEASACTDMFNNTRYAHVATL